MEGEFGKYLVLSPSRYSYWVARHLTGPLQMIDTEVKPGGISATGYEIEGGSGVAPPFPVVGWAPAGALRSNAADMKNYLAANLARITPPIPPARPAAQYPRGTPMAHRRTTTRPPAR